MNQSFNIIVNIITLGFGVYATFTWFKLRDGLLFDNSLLIPKERTIAECRDAAGYIAYIRPRTLVAGIFTFLSGALGLVDSYLGTIQNWAVANGSLGLVVELLVLILIPLAFIVWYGVCLMKAQKKHWP